MTIRNYITPFLSLICTILWSYQVHAQPMLKGPAVSDIMVDVDFSDSLDVTQLLNHEFERINEIDFISLRYAKSDDEQLSIKSIILTYDLDGGKPLYQVDLMFSSTQDAYKMAYDFYGLPNYANHGNVLNEWYFRQPNNLSDIWITLSTNTLVIRALEPNTVWEAKVY